MSLADPVDHVATTQHALERWAQRSPDDAPAIHAAWRAAWPLALPTPEYRNVDRGRYHCETNTVLLVNAGHFRTVLSMAPGDVTSPKGRALRNAVEAQFDVETNRAEPIRYSETQFTTQ